ncbi:MAG: YfhO family protein [Desulfatibacillaceae bacterium]
MVSSGSNLSGTSAGGASWRWAGPPLALYAGLALLLHAPVWLGFVDFYTGNASDLVPFVYGLKRLLYDAVHSGGGLPLWNPHVLLGQPAVGNIQYALFYPLNFLFAVFTFFRAVWISQAIHLVVAGMGGYALARYTGCSRRGSLLAGVLFLLNGRNLYYINAGWLGYFHAVSWMPLFLLVGLRTVSQRGWINPVLFAVLFALSLLAGTPQYSLFGFLLVGAAAVWTIARDRDVREAGHMAARLGFAGILGAALIAVQLLPSLELAGLSSRSLATEGMWGFHFSWDAGQWMRILFRPEFREHDFAWEVCAYIGVGGMLCAFAGIAARWKPQAMFLTVCGVLPFLASMGKAFAPLYLVLVHVPGMNMLTNPSRYFIFTIIVLCIMAGHGAEALLRPGREGARSRYGVAGAAGVFMLLALLMPPDGGAAFPANVWFLGAAAVFLLLTGLVHLKPGPRAAAIFLVVLVLDPLLLSPNILEAGYEEEHTPPQNIARALEPFRDVGRVAVMQPEVLRDNLTSPLPDWFFVENRIGRVGGYEPMGMLHSLQFITRLDGTPPISGMTWGMRPFTFASPELYDLAGVSHVSSLTPMERPELLPVVRDVVTMRSYRGGWWRDAELHLYRNTGALPRAYFLTDDGEVGSVGYVPESTDARKVYVKTDKPGRLVLAESWHPGWRASVKGNQATVEMFLDTFVSVRLPPGEHDVQLVFDPSSWRTGLLVSWLAVMVVLGYFALWGIDRAKTKTP